MASLTRRTFLGAAALGTLGLLGGRAVSADPTPTGDTLTIGYVPIACASPLLAADALGLHSAVWSAAVLSGLVTALVAYRLTESHPGLP